MKTYLGRFIESNSFIGKKTVFKNPKLSKPPNRFCQGGVFLIPRSYLLD